MFAKMRITGLAVFCLFAFAGASLAQISSIEGDVKGEDGKPLQGVQVHIDRKDIKGNYKVKTDKKGHYFYGGLPLGTYRVSIEIDGKERDSVDNVRSQLGDSVPANFNLKESADRNKALSQAAATGTLSKEQERSMSPEQKAGIEKKAKENAANMAKNKVLNDAFTEGKEAQNAKNYEAAAQAFEKAAVLDANQHVIWGSMADSYSAMSKTKTGADQQAAQEKGAAAYVKALELKPDEAAYHNNYALLLAQMKKFPESQAELTKAAEIEPANAGRYFFNLGAVLVNNGQADAAVEAFKKAIAADPNYADAYYQYGVSLVSKATMTPDGKVIPPPGTIEAFQKYLELKPTGKDAEAAKGMITSLSTSVETEYHNPNAPAKKPVKKK